MTVCPSGALAITPYPDVNMGIAVFDESSCLRNFGDSCTECVDRCPLGEDAIRISDDRIDVQLPGCVGCGVCEYYCPTSPRAIQIVPE